MQLDHVIVAVPDLDDAAAALLADVGLVARPGGRHPGWGTANSIIPLGESYLELVTVVDPEVAHESDFGSWVAAAVEHAGAEPAPLGWAVRTDDFDALCVRQGLTPDSGSRRATDGTLLTWSLAGVEVAVAEPALPFIIDWGTTPLPGRVPVSHPAGRTRISGLHVRGDAARVETWLGGDAAALGVTVEPGSPALLGVDLTTPSGIVTLGGAPTSA